MNTEDEIAVHGGIGYWVGALASAFRRGAEQELRPFDIAPAQWAIMELCYRGEANTPSGLSKVIPIDTAAISRHLDRLKDKGLVRRRRSARDRRSITVTLTDEGRALGPVLALRVKANNEKFLKGITEDEEAAFLDIVSKMLRSAEDAVSDRLIGTASFDRLRTNGPLIERQAQD